MRICFLATRLSGTDGVSLETAKWASVLARTGNEIFYVAGELSGVASKGLRVPQMHFANDVVINIQNRMFNDLEISNSENLLNSIKKIALELKKSIKEYLLFNHIEVLIIENALAIPMNIPLGIALMNLISELNIPTIAHHHDFYWERDRFNACVFPEILADNFPGEFANMKHVTINSLAQKSLKNRKNIDSTVIPNVYDFSIPTPGIDSYNRELRNELGFSPKEPLILQPTRVIERKGIEFAIELVHKLNLRKPRLIISHAVGDEGNEYMHRLKNMADDLHVSIEIVNDKIQEHRDFSNGNKVYSLGDIYLNADFITYPSKYEGFGNALLEAIYFKRPMLINCYPVYNCDIKPKGFHFVEINNNIDSLVVDDVRRIIQSPESWKEIGEQNLEIAHDNYSYEILESLLKDLIDEFK